MNNPDRNGRRSERLSGIFSAWGKLLEIEDRIFTQRNLHLYGFCVAWGLDFIHGMVAARCVD